MACRPNPAPHLFLVHKVLLELNHAHLFPYCLWIFSAIMTESYNDRDQMA